MARERKTPVNKASGAETRRGESRARRAHAGIFKKGKKVVRNTAPTDSNKASPSSEGTRPRGLFDGVLLDGSDRL
jgi:hypothetical protein